MQIRVWPFLFLGVVAGGAAAILAALGESFLIIFASVLTIIIVFALFQEAMRDPIDEGDIEAPIDVAKPLPTGFGRAMLEQMPLPLLVISRQGRIVCGNLAAKETFPALKAGDHFASLLRVPVFVDAVNAAVDNGKSSKISFTTSQPHERYYEASIGLMPAATGCG